MANVLIIGWTKKFIDNLIAYDKKKVDLYLYLFPICQKFYETFTMNSYPTFIHSSPFYRYDLVPNYKHFTDWDRCTECNINTVHYTCNNCRNHVCNNQKCSISFPSL